MSTGQRVPPTVRRDAAAERARVAPPGRRDRDAEFTAFVAESGPALVRTAWLLCGDRTRGEDLAQQALLRETTVGDPNRLYASMRLTESSPDIRAPSSPVTGPPVFVRHGCPAHSGWPPQALSRGA